MSPAEFVVERNKSIAAQLTGKSEGTVPRPFGFGQPGGGFGPPMAFKQPDPAKCVAICTKCAAECEACAKLCKEAGDAAGAKACRDWPGLVRCSRIYALKSRRAVQTPAGSASSLCQDCAAICAKSETEKCQACAKLCRACAAACVASRGDRSGKCCYSMMAASIFRCGELIGYFTKSAGDNQRSSE